MNTQTQHQRILKWFKTHRELTNYQAFAHLGITSIHRRFTELRKRGIPISPGRWIDTRGGHRVKAYWLESKRRPTCKTVLR